MVHLKLFEEYNNQSDIQVGDYVICDPSNVSESEEMEIFIENNIGQYVEYDEDYDSEFPYRIYYADAPKSMFGDKHDKHIEVSKEEIIYFSPNIEDLEIFISVNKYNL